MSRCALKRIKIIFTVTVLASALVFLVLVNLEGIREQENSGVFPDNMPEYFTHFSLGTLDGDSFTEKDFRDARITVINGWGNTCKACINEMPVLQELSEEYAPRGLQLVSIVADYGLNPDSEESARIVAATRFSCPVLIPDERFDREVYPMTEDSLPSTWFVNSRGEIVGFVSGSNSKEGWAKLFDEYLARY